MIKLGIIYTGGTLGCVQRTRESALSPLPSEAFVTAFERLVLPCVSERAVQFLPAMRFSDGTNALDSTDATPQDWCLIAGQILEQESLFDAFVVIHGTDTLEYTSCALYFLLQKLDKPSQKVWHKPVILTGSQKPLFELDHRHAVPKIALHGSSDALANLQGAMAAAAFGRCASPVCLYFGGQLWEGDCARKWYTTDYAGFLAPNRSPVQALLVDSSKPGIKQACVPLDEANKTDLQQQLQEIAAHLDNTVVVSVKASPMRRTNNPLATWVQALLGGLVQADGLILEGFGSGNFPRSKTAEGDELYQALRFSGVPVVVTSQVPMGPVAVGDYASGSWLATLGVIGAGDMTSSCTYVKLLLLLALGKARGWGGKEIHTYFPVVC